MQNLLGKEVIKSINENIAIKRKLLDKMSIEPVLCVMMFNASSDDYAYKNTILKKCEKNTISCKVVEEENEQEFIEKFRDYNKDINVDGIIIMGKLTDKISQTIKLEIDERKDVDGVGYINMAKLYSGEEATIPCTSEAVLKTFDYYNIDLKGKNVTVIGRSNIIGKPLFMSILARGATVTVCHSKTNDLKKMVENSDIVCSAVGRKNLVTSDMVNNNMVVIDIGINVDENGNMCGDVDYDKVSEIVKAITPVPGGVGMVTNSVLVEHVLDSALKRKEK